MGAQWKHQGRVENAQAKGKIIGKLAKEIIVAAKAGGPDPDTNARLRLAIAAGKKASMTKDTLERAIKKGSGQLDEEANYEVVTYEGFGPHRVPIVVECLTDNRTRTATNVRTLFRKFQLAATGAVTWDFRHLGQVEASPPKPDTDAETEAIEAGAQEVEAGENGQFRFLTEATDLDSVGRALTARGWTLHTSSLVWRAKNPVKLEASQVPELEAFLADIDEDDDVQNIYVGFET